MNLESRTSKVPRGGTQYPRFSSERPSIEPPELDKMVERINELREIDQQGLLSLEQRIELCDLSKSLKSRIRVEF